MRITENQLRQIIREELNEARFAPMGSLKVHPNYPPQRQVSSVTIDDLDYREVYNDPELGTEQWDAVGTATIRGRSFPFEATFTYFGMEPESILRGIARELSNVSGLPVPARALDPDLNGKMGVLMAGIEASSDYYNSALGGDVNW